MEDSTSRCFRIVCSLYFYFVMTVAILSSFFTVLCLSIVLLPLFAVAPQRRLWILGPIHHFLMHTGYKCCSPIWQVKILRQRPPAEEIYRKKTIVMVNHQSKLDAWIVGSILLGVSSKFVVKASLLEVPVVGWLLRLSDTTLAVHFSKEKGNWSLQEGASKALMEEATKTLNEGNCIVVFPEGTRSVTGRLQPFKKGFFRLATEMQDVRILPIALHGQNRVWSVSEKWITPGTSYAIVGDFIDAEGLTADELAERTRDAIAKLQQESPAYDAERDKPTDQVPAQRGHGL